MAIQLQENFEMSVVVYNVADMGTLTSSAVLLDFWRPFSMEDIFHRPIRRSRLSSSGLQSFPGNYYPYSTIGGVFSSHLIVSVVPRVWEMPRIRGINGEDQHLPWWTRVWLATRRSSETGRNMEKLRRKESLVQIAKKERYGHHSLGRRYAMHSLFRVISLKHHYMWPVTSSSS